MEPDPAGRRGTAEERRKRVTASLVSLAAVGLVVAHMVRPDLKVDAATLVLAAIAVLPWLGSLFESIELPGGAKLQYRQLQERVAEAEQRATEAQLAVGAANRQARAALVVTSGDDTPPEDVSREVQRLTEEFARLRRTAPSSADRTYRQELIAAELVRLTPLLSPFDVLESLHSTDSGTRLAAYARLYACPEGEFLLPLAAAAAAEPLAFSQYWGFRAVDAVIDVVGPSSVPLAVVRILRAAMAELPNRASDRSAQLRSTLARLEEAASV
ncbi:hypothetical protein CFP65_1785 [Kitasatospora sp. MMS16-BH015]|nr:hypothetical protein CFP65_1785 [Kitasatospora sp. MMS16-BH015]